MRDTDQPVLPRRTVRFVVLLALCSSAFAVASCTVIPPTYDVGPGQPLAKLSDVPWQSLSPDATVRIHYRPQPYQEKVVLTESGTPGHPIRVVGVPGPNGEQPVIDGNNATAAYGPALFPNNATLESLAVITIYRTQIHPYGYVPSNITVSGLDVRNGTYDTTYVGADGQTRSYISDGSSGIWAQGNNLTFDHNTIDFNGNGIFISSKGTAGTSSSNVLFDANEFHDNGDPRSSYTYRDHAIYAEGVHVVYQANHFKPMLPNSYGEQIKDRSAGTVIRYNRFEGGKANVVQLECAADNETMVANDPSYRQAFIYGNVFQEGQGESTQMVSDGDWPNACPNGDVRNATLYFYANTVLLTKNKSGTDWSSYLLFLNTNVERAEVFDNIIAVRPATPGSTPTSLYLSLHPGSVSVGKNWISAGWQPLGTSSSWPAGTVTVTGPILNNPTNDPGFVDVSAGDLHLVAGGAAVDQGVALPAAALPTDDVTAQYVAERGTVSRPVVGAAPDLGAFEHGLPSAGTVGSGGPPYPFPPLPPGASNGPG